MTSLKTGLHAIALCTFACMVFYGCNASSTNESSMSENSPQEQLYAVGDFAGSHILIAYAGASRASDEITRSKEEALEKATELIGKIKVAPATFEDFAREESDGPSGVQGGSLGNWAKGQMVPEFDAAVELLEIGDISEEPVETAFGYHIIRRDNNLYPHYAADAFIVAFTAPQTPATVTRTPEEAQVLADSIKEVLTADSFVELANAHNDLNEGPIPFNTFPDDGSREPIPGLADSLKNIAFNSVIGPLEIPIGYAFVRRLKVDQRAGSHILISYTGARNANPDVSRTKEEALEEAMRLTALAKENPDQFAELAMEHSNGPSGPTGGDLGIWFKGRMVPEFDSALDNMVAGDITDEPVETEYGYHVIKRNELN